MLAELVRGTESAGDPIRCDTGKAMKYRIAGNFGGSKFWRMTKILRFGEFYFGVKGTLACLATVNYYCVNIIIFDCE